MKARRKFRQSKSHGFAWAILFGLVGTAIIVYGCILSLFTIYNNWIADLPELNSDAFNFAQESFMYAEDEETLLARFQLEKRDPIELDQVNDYVIKSTIDVEDVRFYEHEGVDVPGIVRALVNNLTGGQLEGASTISQQLVRNTMLSEEATDITLERKVREAELAIELEKRYSKDEILTMYLNTINYADGCYGIEAAAQNYFQVSAKDLSLVQAATLAGIPQSPTMFNPKENPDDCLERRNAVLERMLAAGDITQKEYRSAIKKDLGLDPAPDDPDQGIYAYPYFTSYVRDELMKPDNIYGCSYADLFEGGLKIYTTLDVDMQKKAEEACEGQYENMEEGLDCALVAMDPENGYVKAIVGGRDFFDDQWNIATQGGRPAGSTFKAFTLTTAIENGMSPLTALDCSDPVTTSDGTEIHNFDSIDYGTRTIASATAVSANTGFYRLADRLGATKISDMAHRMGIESELPPYPIITLGTENVTPLEMAEAYSTLASGGIHRESVVITRIENKEGEVIFESADTSERVLEEDVAGAVTKVLRRVFEDSEATAYGDGPTNGQQVAGKTGTGQEFRDHWLVGYSPTLTCATWIGSRDYSSTSEDLTANALWKSFMSSALEGTEVKDFPSTPDPEYTNKNEEMRDSSSSKRSSTSNYDNDYSSTNGNSDSDDNSSSDDDSDSSTTGNAQNRQNESDYDSDSSYDDSDSESSDGESNVEYEEDVESDSTDSTSDEGDDNSY